MNDAKQYIADLAMPELFELVKHAIYMKRVERGLPDKLRKLATHINRHFLPTHNHEQVIGMTIDLLIERAALLWTVENKLRLDTMPYFEGIANAVESIA